MPDDKSNHATDALVLLTGAHADRMTDSLRGVGIQISRLETVCRDLIKSNKELVEELKKGRRRGEKDRRKG